MIPFLFLVGIHWKNNTILTLHTLLSLLLFVCSVLWIACIYKPYRRPDGIYVLPYTAYMLTGLTAIAAGIYMVNRDNTLAAWIMLGGS